MTTFRSFKKTAANSDSWINWLRQPGQICNESPKSMRENFNTFIKFCATRTVPSTWTESVGLAADAPGVLVFAAPFALFHRDPKLTNLTRTGKNHATATQTPTNSTAGPLVHIIHIPARYHLDNFTVTRNLCPFIRTHPSKFSWQSSNMFYNAIIIW
jgi:hypothetical protein